MALRDRLRARSAPYLQAGERPETVLVAAVRDLRRYLLGTAVAVAVAAAVGGVVLALLPAAAPGWVPSAFLGAVAGGSGALVLRQLLVVGTSDGRVLLSLQVVTGRPRGVDGRVAVSDPVVVRTGVLTDRVRLGPYDLWVARRFRKDVHALAAGTEPVPGQQAGPGLVDG